MSKTTKKKHVTQEAIESDFIPKNGQFIAKVITARGNNLHEVESQYESESILVSMPLKFRKTIWIKRDNFVMCDPIDEGTKVRGEICACLLDDHIRYLKKLSLWPQKFDNTGSKQATEDSKFYLSADIPLPSSSESSQSEDENEDQSEITTEFKVMNLNRVVPEETHSSSESETEEACS